LRSILVFSANLRLGLPSGLFPSGLPTNILYVCLVSIRATYPANLILLDVIILIGPFTVAERSKACTVFARSEAEIVGSNPTKGMDVWYVFILCVLSCV
jgi:hypothetical protein